MPITVYELLKRPEINYGNIEHLDENRPELKKEIMDFVETVIKYEGYILKQTKQIEQYRKLENKTIPNDLCYNNISGLRIEAQQKLEKIKPKSIGQASRISGVSPSDINVLLIYLEQRRRSKDNLIENNLD
jgi:tRNA uridine 5-carboxymethylaminomethyl modification enzyme